MRVEVPPADVLRELDLLRAELAEVRTSRSRVVLADEVERRGYERALHDGVQQRLVGLTAGVELAARSIDAHPAAAKELLADIQGELQLALEDARKLAHRISPPLLETGGLLTALRTAAASVGVPIRVDVRTEVEPPPLIAGVVYRCCLDVVERVGVGAPVTITVRDENGDLTFEIVAARELDAGGPPLRDRVEALGGRLERSVDQGTRLSGSLPLPG